MRMNFDLITWNSNETTRIYVAKVRDKKKNKK